MRPANPNSRALWLSSTRGPAVSRTTDCAVPDALLREQPARIREGLELERIAARVEEEHRRLFADFAREADVRFDCGIHTFALPACCKLLPILHRQHDAEDAHWHVVAVDQARLALASLIGCQMRDDLVTVQVEVDPAVRRPTLGTTKQAAVESARIGERRDGEGKVERTKCRSVPRLKIEAQRRF